MLVIVMLVLVLVMVISDVDNARDVNGDDGGRGDSARLGIGDSDDSMVSAILNSLCTSVGIFHY